MAPRSRSGMRLSDLAAVEEFFPPRERHSRVFSGGAVGDAVAVEALQALALARGSISFYAFAECFWHGFVLRLLAAQGGATGHDCGDEEQ